MIFLCAGRVLVVLDDKEDKLACATIQLIPPTEHEDMTAVILLIVFALLIIILLIVAIFVYCLKCKKPKKPE